jgi:hypothetical protein
MKQHKTAYICRSYSHDVNFIKDYMQLINAIFYIGNTPLCLDENTQWINK